MIDPSRVYIRNDTLDGVDSWYWITGDTGTWQGPSEEWAPLRDKIMSLVRGRRTIIQAGGAMGMYPKLWSRHFQRVYTFEPTPLSFYVLNLNCTEENIYKFNAGLSGTHEGLSINRDSRDNAGMNRIGPPTETAIPIAVLRIDDFGFGDLDALQLDIEGWEYQALLGGSETIQRCHPVISLETIDGPIGDLLKSWGYQDRGHGGYDKVFEWVGA